MNRSDHEPPHNPAAELGSIHATLLTLTARVETVALDAHGRAAGSRLASDLFAVENALRSAQRKLAKVVTNLDR